MPIQLALSPIMPLRRPRCHTGFTLIELLIVVTVIGTLLGVLVPSLGRASVSARSVKCRTQLRQMAVAAETYAMENRGSYPPAQHEQRDDEGNLTALVTWEITTLLSPHQHVPGILWEEAGAMQIQQCPSYEGPDNWTDAPYTGYNYNTSYIGHGLGETVAEPIKNFQVESPAQCAMFGDGGWLLGANKFMRSPLILPGDFAFGDASFVDRQAGTQAFRHGGHTNVAYCDGHADTQDSRHTDVDGVEESKIAPGTGFLSNDNTAYDVR